jgi:SAP domain-containing protein
MSPRNTTVLSPQMTLREFHNGYWYRDQLTRFAQHIGIPSAAKLRKDELEQAIVTFLRTGTAALPTKRSLRKTGVNPRFYVVCTHDLAIPEALQHFAERIAVV